MLYLLTHYWIWLAVAFAVGVVTPLLAQKLGWAADLENYWLQRIGVVLAIVVVVIVMQLVSGRPELMLEAAAGLVAAYIVGGIAGGIAPGLLPARFEGWWVGLFATGLIWLVFSITTMPKVEPDLRERVAEVVKSAGADPLNFDVSGRDVLLPDDLGAKRAVLSEQIGQVKGVRLVSEVEELSGAALAAKTVARLQAEVAAKAEADAKAKAEAEAREAVEKAAVAKAAKDTAAKQAAAKAKADAEAKEAAAKEAAAKEAAEIAAKEAAAKEAAAKEAAAKEAAAKEAAAKEAAAKSAAAEEAKPAAVAPPAAPAAAAATRTADAAGTASIPSVEACQSKLSTLVAAQKINFMRGSAEIAQASLPVLKQLAEVIAHCPAATIEVAGHTDAAGKKAANEALSKRRAEAVADNLTKAGIGSAKLTAVGYGASKPLAANDSADGRAKNRRIEFVVK
ncbi:OmpA/MotB [Rhodopseudomonas palustris HaA2]|uniref:OmpA/MotB n=1 Tax=Rhodopseudomonas palustris (strain HaA2) TaxID=316058 RepID=Q2IU25_RHOP2|nr:OmpA family protein [Rhodopseudomonas palustris]ABD08285.1 OmpA/MotB [Rhodopseudomonas palustris HaA2]